MVTTGLDQARRARLIQDAPEPFATLMAWTEPFRTFNAYGLFARMTPTRPEILLEGSADGVTWKAYDFRWKPGDPARAPSFVAPYQPRLDWQMWFAALAGDCRRVGWFLQFEHRLLEGSPAVLALLASNPFPERPPAIVRARLEEYHFTDRETRARDGTWWRSRPLGLFCPPVSLRDLERR